ncbi:uncharacterized protein LOC131230594 [Magnolia sinica]|uniref:uncharacterized protein LOC131230594 n=1 Tax=Magnolia sinica TaxID=86752 RepID=UPI0026583CAC|nr:uncharacterized protein LOC131230594 [Magnolia sinica]
MSGNMGPTRSNIVLPSEEQHHDPNPINPLSSQDHHRLRLIRFRQLNTLAVLALFSATGMIAIEEYAFIIFSVFYIYFLSKVAFPTLTLRLEPPVFSRNRFLAIYVWISTLISLFLPIIYIFQGIYEGDKEGIKAAAPPVVLLAAQIFLEGMTFSRRFALPVRALVPVFYNTKRLFMIVEWLKIEIGKVEKENRWELRLQFGRGLAVANLIYWSFNLFGLLLPFYLPRVFKRYYSMVKG